MDSSSDDEYPSFPKFSGGPPGREWCPFEWFLWRQQFENVVKLRNLEDKDAKCYAAISMTETAATRTLYIERGPDDGPDKVSLAMFLDRLEAMFSPPPDSLMAQNEFDYEAGRGQLERNIVVYHNRLRLLWKRAYPNSFEDDPILIHKFIMGITDTSVRRRVQDQDPKTSSEARDLAVGGA